MPIPNVSSMSEVTDVLNRAADLPIEDVAEMFGVSLREMRVMLRVVREQPAEPGDEAILAALHEREEPHLSRTCACYTMPHD